jgi:hypothetical protein
MVNLGSEVLNFHFKNLIRKLCAPIIDVLGGKIRTPKGKAGPADKKKEDKRKMNANLTGRASAVRNEHESELVLKEPLNPGLNHLALWIP